MHRSSLTVYILSLFLLINFWNGYSQLPSMCPLGMVLSRCVALSKAMRHSLLQTLRSGVSYNSSSPPPLPPPPYLSSPPQGICIITTHHLYRYTSLDGVADTYPNPALLIPSPSCAGDQTARPPAGAYLPACMLGDQQLERAGRTTS